MAVVGAFEVDEVVAGEPEAMWEEVGAYTCISREEYDAYFGGATQAVGIRVAQVEAFEESFPLELLRNEWDGFSPPQSYRYLCSERARLFRR